MQARKEHLDGLAVGLLVACCAFWGFQQILIKVTVNEVPPMWQAALRFAGATGLLWGWCHWRGVPLFQRDGTLGAGLLAGVLFAGEFTCLYLGIQYTSASRLTVFLYTSPFVVALLVPRFIPSEALGRPQWIGLILAFVAVVVAFSENLDGIAAEQWLGDGLALLAAVLWGLTTLTIRITRLAQASAEKILFYQLAVTALLAPILSFWLGETWSLQYSGQAWGSLLLQTVVGAFASYLAWMWLLRYYPATRVATFVFLTPVFTLIFGVWLLGESLTLQLMVAVVGVALGIVMVSRHKGGRPAPVRQR